jgi:hypothetical protein
MSIGMAGNRVAAPIVHPGPIVTEKDAAPYCAVSIAFLRKCRARGTGPAFLRMGRTVRYLRDDLDAWLRQHRVITGESGRLNHTTGSRATAAVAVRTTVVRGKRAVPRTPTLA